MKQRNGFRVMVSLIGLVKPLTGYMALAILLGLLGQLSASFITIFGGYAILEILGLDTPFTLMAALAAALVLAMFRGPFRYGEQLCNHFIAFRLLALIRDRVFGALRRLCPAKLEGKDKGNLISVITADIELLEVFYAHTVSPVMIALLFTLFLGGFISSLHPVMGAVAF
ncbi:MAG: ABC transporter ATP-binding protein, partial [Lachnospiraceae bacterium]